LKGQEGALENGSIRSLMKGNVLVLTVSRVIWSMSMSIVFPFLSLYIIELGGSKPIVGMVNALGSVAGMALFPLGGYLADKAGRAKFVGIATFLFASSFLLFIFAPTWQWLAVGVVYQQIVLFYMPALNAIMAERTGTALVVVNSVCGCAAGMARPGVNLALQQGPRPDRLGTVFAGMDEDAVARARNYFTGYPPSSPSMGSTLSRNI